MHPHHHLVPQSAGIVAIEPESADTRTFTLALAHPLPAFDAARPGQFVMVSIPGTGEAAFTLSSLPAAGGQAGHVVVTVRRVGTLTTALFARPVGARVGVRGPFGRGFPGDGAELPTLYVAGGCGLAPLKATIDQQLYDRRPDMPLAIVYGAREPETRIHTAALARWARTPGVRVVECVEHASAGWTGQRGLLIEFVTGAADAIGARRAAICGPPAMLAPVAYRLRHAGLRAEDIFLALERHMQCGTGECGHCYVNHRYVCRDGPVFSLAELEELPDAFGDPADSWSASCP